MVEISVCDTKFLAAALKVIVTLLIAIVPMTARVVEDTFGTLNAFESRVFALLFIIAAALYDPTLGVLLTILYVAMMLQSHSHAMKKLYDSYESFPTSLPSSLPSAAREDAVTEDSDSMVDDEQPPPATLTTLNFPGGFDASPAFQSWEEAAA
jgi:hypothetical protein